MFALSLFCLMSIMFMLFFAAFDKQKVHEGPRNKTFTTMKMAKIMRGVKIEDDTDQVGGESEVNSLRVGRDLDVEEEQDEEDQVEVEVEALQTTIAMDSENNNLICRSPAVNTNNTDKTLSK